MITFIGYCLAETANMQADPTTDKTFYIIIIFIIIITVVTWPK